jgi:hypothetical protein
MNIVSHSKCKLCRKVLEIDSLKDNKAGVGYVCVDSKTCIGRIAKNWLPKNP